MDVAGRVAAGLFGAWLVHDVEEWVTLAAWSRKNAQELTRLVPVRSPWGDDGMSDQQAHAAIAATGALVLLAAASGARSGGRSRLFHTALLGFGIHGLSHLGGSALFRGYTPGVLTAPSVVLPYAVWAVRTLSRAGLLHQSVASWAGAVAAVPVTVGGLHYAAALSTAVRHRPETSLSDAPVARENAAS